MVMLISLFLADSTKQAVLPKFHGTLKPDKESLDLTAPYV
jgi:hypothetical protein